MSILLLVLNFNCDLLNNYYGLSSCLRLLCSLRRCRRKHLAMKLWFQHLFSFKVFMILYGLICSLGLEVSNCRCCCLSSVLSSCLSSESGLSRTWGALPPFISLSQYLYYSSVKLLSSALAFVMTSIGICPGVLSSYFLAMVYYSLNFIMMKYLK